VRFPVFAYAKAQMQPRVIERLEAGMTLTALGREPGFPSRQTLLRWTMADPDFADRLRRARAWGQGRKRAARAGPVFDPARAEAFLLAIRRGETMPELMARPEWPNRALLNRWKRESPQFAQALAAAVRFSFELRGPRRPFDQAIADAIIVRVTRGERLPDLVVEKAMPSHWLLARWRRRRPDFAAALNIAMEMGRRQRLHGNCKQTPALTAAIARHVQDGGSLMSAAQAVPGAPHHLTLYAWDRTRPGFAREIAQARALRDQVLLDTALEIGANTTPETVAADTARFAQLRLRYARLQPKRKR
jgi:hypothetical protein